MLFDSPDQNALRFNWPHTMASVVATLKKRRCSGAILEAGRLKQLQRSKGIHSNSSLNADDLKCSGMANGKITGITKLSHFCPAQLS